MKNPVKKAVKKVTKKELTQNDYINAIRELNTLTTERLTIKKREDELKKIINPYLDTSITPDANGHRFYKTTDLSGNSLIIKREAKKSVTIDDDKARDFFKDNDLLDRVLVVETVEKWDEDEIENLLAEELITVEDIGNITNTKVTYATTFVKVKEEEGE